MTETFCPRIALLERLQMRLPGYYVTVEASMDDAFVLCVRVYDVPNEKIAELVRRILDIEELILTGTRYVVIPMVKTEETTNRYYPDKKRKAVS